MYKTPKLGVSKISKQLPFLWSFYYVECDLNNTKLKSPNFYLISKPPNYYQKTKNQPKKRKNDPVESFTFSNILSKEEELVFNEILSEETFKVDELFDYGFLDEKEPNQKLIDSLLIMDTSIEQNILQDIQKNKDLFTSLSQRIPNLNFRVEYILLKQNIILIELNIGESSDHILKCLEFLEKCQPFHMFIMYLLKFRNYDPKKQKLFEYISDIIQTQTFLYNFIQFIKNIIKEKDFLFSTYLTNLSYNLKKLENEYSKVKTPLNNMNDYLKIESTKNDTLKDSILEFLKSDSLINIQKIIQYVFLSITKFRDIVFKGTDFDIFPSIYINLICQILDYKVELSSNESSNLEWMVKRK